jgi:hypothetical protein
MAHEKVEICSVAKRNKTLLGSVAIHKHYWNGLQFLKLLAEIVFSSIIQNAISCKRERIVDKGVNKHYGKITQTHSVWCRTR